MDSSDEERPIIGRNKKFELYGVFANDIKSSSDEERAKPVVKANKFLNFKILLPTVHPKLSNQAKIMGYLHFPGSFCWSNERWPHLSVKTEIAVSIVWDLDCVNRKLILQFLERSQLFL